MHPDGAGDNPKFSSPDETANYFWAKRLAQGQPLYYFEELNGPGNNLIHPRSINVIDGKNVPGSFLGLIFIYGSLAKILGLGVVPYLTPFFSALGIFFFYLLLKKIFNSTPVALIPATLLAFTPAWFYYSCRGMYHNVLFTSLLIMGVYFLWKVLAEAPSPNSKSQAPNQKSKINNPKLMLYFLSGLLISFALFTRTSEIVWAALTIFFIFIFHFKRIYWPGFLLFLAAGTIPIIALFYHNQILYGSLISAGYRAVSDAVSIGGLASAGVLFQIFVTPFGIHPGSILTNGFNYLYQLFPIWGALYFLGAFLFAILPTHIIKINYKKRIAYLAYCLLLTAYLLIFYGSWAITDRIDRETLSLGTSYLRYWLPIYIVTLPFVATIIWQLANFLTPLQKRKIFYQSIFSFAACLCIFMPTINVLLRQSDESLFLLKNLNETRVKSAIVNKMVGPEDIVLVYKQADKIFFPERTLLITELAVPIDYESVATLSKIRDVYYYSYANPRDVDSISRLQFAPYGLEIVEGQKVFGNDRLYKIKKIRQIQ
ncbi:hypothetical protein GYA54_02890 [Candidatus Kuenenbacteria bacterium]|nr:hypothetical protein [Candidatus Kuenenbacteria bacterium]